MKKIIVAFDGLKYSVAAQDYAINLAIDNNALLVGVFLDDLYYHSYKIYDIISEKEGGIDNKLRRRLDKKDAVIRTRSLELFETACARAGISFSIHKDHNAAVRELLRESIYADLLVISESETFSRLAEEAPTSFLQGLLAHVQCPVFVVPSSYTQVDEVVLLYDGEPSSVHAIKMLCYILPPFAQLPTEVVTVAKPKKKTILPEPVLVKEFISRHFSNTRFHILKGEPEKVILSFLRKKRANTLVVLGAYRRSAVSRWFRHSMADLLTNKTSMPLFIAHNK